MENRIRRRRPYHQGFYSYTPLPRQSFGPLGPKVCLLGGGASRFTSLPGLPFEAKGIQGLPTLGSLVGRSPGTRQDQREASGLSP